MLLLVGYLTTPTAAVGVSLSELWAWVRYFYAIAETPDLRLTDDFADLDAHQKTILSDDFGMGVSMAWLTEKLQLVACCDGRYFTERFSAITIPVAHALKKRGPMKCPDFVGIDQNNLCHIVECKGTQSGNAFQTRQLNGAVVQKRMISVQPPYQGQQLACALTIAREKTGQVSNLTILDPESDDVIQITEQNIDLALDPILRSSVARALRLSGFMQTADVIAAPSGRRPDDRPIEGSRRRRLEASRQDFLRQRSAQALIEIATSSQKPSFEIAKKTYVGRKMRLDLPRPLKLSGKTFGAIEIEQGLPQECLNQFTQGALEDLPIMKAAPWVRHELNKIILSGDGTEAHLDVGGLFHSGIKLLN